MNPRKMSRRQFLYAATTFTLSGVLAACTKPPPPATEPAPQPTKADEQPKVEPTKVVEQPKVEPTQVPGPVTVPGLPGVEGPHQYDPDELPAFSEAPMLAEQVKAGQLPPVEERLPTKPPVVIPSEEVGKYGGNVRMAYQALGHWVYVANMMNHSDLVRQRQGFTMEFEADLAERWETSSDAKVWTFYLREGLKWSDGEPFTTADIMFWYEHVLLNKDLVPAVPPHWRDGDQVAKMEAVDARTLRISYSTPRPLLLLALTTESTGRSSMANWLHWTLHPKHYMSQFHVATAGEAGLKAKVEAVGLGSWTDLYKREIEPHTASAGRPYMTAYIPDGPAAADGRWSWTRNPYFHKIDPVGQQLPYIDTWTAHMFGDTEAMTLNLVAGEYDWVTLFLRADGIPPIQDGIDRGAPLKFVPHLNAKCGEVSIYMNYTTTDLVLREIFNDVRFRQAVSLAIHREEASLARFRGHSMVAQASFPPSDPYLFDQEWFDAFTEHDPARANELLDEMGLTSKDSAGYRLRPDGQRLTIIFDMREGNHTEAIELLPEYMKTIGIELQIRPAASTLFTERVNDNNVQWAGWSSEFSFFTVNQLYAGGFRPYGIEWRRWYDSKGEGGMEPPPDMKRVFELCDAALAAQTVEERVKHLREAGELHKKNLWVIGIAGMDVRPDIMHKDIKNTFVSAHGMNGVVCSHHIYGETIFWDK